MDNALPSYVIYITLFLGGAGALIKPYWALYASVFLTSAISLDGTTFTRTTLFGPYLNLGDAIQVVMLLALVFALLRERRQIKISKLFLAMTAILLVGTITIASVIPLYYDVLREIRWAFIFPFIFLIFSNLIFNREQLKPLLVSLFIGSFFAAGQHLQYVIDSRTAFETYNTFGAFRTITFDSAANYFLVAAPFIIWPEHKSPKIVQLIYYLGLALFAISLILNQTRSMWIATILAILSLALWLRKFDSLLKGRLLLMGLFVAGVFFVGLPWLDPVEIVNSRLNFLNEELVSSSGSTSTRQWQVVVEIWAWLQGNWFTGRGLGMQYIPSIFIEGLKYEYVAWGHIGHISYLARLGLIGLAVYTFYLPVASLKAGKLILTQEQDVWIYNLVLIGIGSVFYNWWLQFMSGSYLAITALIPAILIGALWGVASVQGVEQSHPLVGLRSTPKHFTRRRLTNSAMIRRNG